MTSLTGEEVGKIMGQPVAVELQDAVLKIRLNLLIISCIGLLIGWWEVRVNPASTVLGFQFEGLTDLKLRRALLLVNAYSWLHFFWYAAEAFAEWRLRMTGARGLSADAGSFQPDNALPRQSTLNFWWSQQIKQITECELRAEGWRRMLTDIDGGLKASPPADALNTTPYHEALKKIDALQNEIFQTNHSLALTRQVLESQRIPASLQRFEEAFRQFVSSQSLRWILLEVGLPLAMGWASMFFLAKNVDLF